MLDKVMDKTRFSNTDRWMDRQGLHYMPYYYGRGIKRKQNLAV
jgi:hypothetical protein